ncbi:hypothetical protein DAI22_06g272700 [Oryza sativa Japonica Group]|nr:hypothetical protein DAI22_06g272700 [Oryza sativa Japonica Group]
MVGGGGYRQKLIQVWNDWQVSVLVLLSLTLQLLFLSTAGARRRAQPSWGKKTYFWALYIGSRFITTYSLGILSRASTGDANADIQAFWASLLLFHLGGPDDFTALSLEDNKLWDRRCLELFIQVSTTLYVFSRYVLDPGFRRFIVPFALIFSAGVVKYVEQVVALHHATMEALIKSVLGKPDAGPDYADTINRLDGIMRSGALPSLDIKNERVDRPNSDPEANVQVKDYSEDEQVAIKTIRSAHSLFSRFSVLFADGIFSFEDRQESQAMFLRKDARWAFKIVEIELGFAYDRLYTKASVSRGARLAVRVCSLSLTLAAGLWAALAILRASQYRQRHRCVTYALLAGAALNDAAILAAHAFSVWSLVHGDWLSWCSVMLVKRRRWSASMAQSNLVTFCLRKLPSNNDSDPAPLSSSFLLRRLLLGGGRGGGVQQQDASPAPALSTTLASMDEFQKLFERRSLLDQVRSGSFWSKYKHTKYVPVSEKLKDFIYAQLEEKVRRLSEYDKRMERERERERKRVVHPLMLSSSTTMAIKRCRDTCAEARRLFLKDHVMAAAGKGKGDRRRAVGEDNAHRVLLDVDTPLHAAVVKGDKCKSVLWDGCFLARELRQSMADPGRRWRVVCEVWVEMLGYAAVHCGGYQHAERLKDGGELITFVCLLMTHLGMGKHYRTEVGDAYAHLSPYSAAA